MTLSVSQSVTALGPLIPASFLASGGTDPYTYSVLPGGAGGVIDPDTGAYLAPAGIPANPDVAFDTIQAEDSLGDTGTARIFVATPLLLFCDILQHELELADGRVYIWDQKIMQPKDSGLYVAVSVPSCHPFANTTKPASTDAGLDAQQAVHMMAVVDIDIISRGPAARDRKEEVILALNSIYAQQQQEINGFYVGKLKSAIFNNISGVDGAAIPYRYRISVNMQYTVTKVKAVQYFDNNFDPESNTDS